MIDALQCHNGSLQCRNFDVSSFHGCRWPEIEFACIFIQKPFARLVQFFEDIDGYIRLEIHSGAQAVKVWFAEFDRLAEGVNLFNGVVIICKTIVECTLNPDVLLTGPVFMPHIGVAENSASIGFVANSGNRSLVGNFSYFDITPVGISCQGHRFVVEKEFNSSRNNR